MRILITIKGGASSIEGDVPVASLGELVEVLKAVDFLPLEKSSCGGTVMVNKTAIAYITRKQ